MRHQEQSTDGLARHPLGLVAAGANTNDSKRCRQLWQTLDALQNAARMEVVDYSVNPYPFIAEESITWVGWLGNHAPRVVQRDDLPLAVEHR